ISVVFTLPEDSLPPVMKRMAAGASLQVEAYDRANKTKLYTGALAAIDNQVDVTTGTVKLRASFSNTDDALFPNQFVNVRLLVDTRNNVLKAPVAAIQTGAPGTFVYLVKPDSTVAVAKVQTGVSQGGTVEITSGLNEGDRVVIEGSD